MVSHIRLFVSNWNAVGDKLAWGLILARSDDIGTSTAGLTAAKFELPWSWQETLFPTTNGAAVNAMAIYDRTVKARRKLHDINTRYLLSVTNQSAVTSLTVKIRSRTLVALP
jgi:hypothetical protein